MYAQTHSMSSTELCLWTESAGAGQQPPTPHPTLLGCLVTALTGLCSILPSSESGTLFSQASSSLYFLLPFTREDLTVVELEDVSGQETPWLGRSRCSKCFPQYRVKGLQAHGTHDTSKVWEHTPGTLPPLSVFLSSLSCPPPQIKTGDTNQLDQVY